MVKHDFCEIWQAAEREIKGRMMSGKQGNHSIRDFFVQEVLQQYIPGFSIDDLSRNEHGKPQIPSSEISFNLSHCEDNYSLLVCSSEFCGLDIQTKQNLSKFDNALKSVLTDGEYRILSKRENKNEFFQMWSVKEAFIKAKGSSIWFGRDYDFSEILPEYTDRWTFIHNMYLYSREFSPGFYLSVVLPHVPVSIDFKKF